jgi:hypothetical protein
MVEPGYCPEARAEASWLVDIGPMDFPFSATYQVDIVNLLKNLNNGD